MEASEPKWVNSDYISYGVNSLWLRCFHILYIYQYKYFSTIFFRMKKVVQSWPSKVFITGLLNFKRGSLYYLDTLYCKNLGYFLNSPLKEPLLFYITDEDQKVQILYKSTKSWFLYNSWIINFMNKKWI